MGSILQKWICNTCGFETTEKPACKNTTCWKCGKGRFQMWNLCECGKWFHAENSKQKYCSTECGYKYKKTGGKKGKHYPHLQRSEVRTCPICGKEFRAVDDYRSRRQKYCSKECWSNRGTVTKECKYCGKKIITYKSSGKVYCNQNCRDADYRNFTGEKARAWQGGKTKKAKCIRTSAAYREWRTAVFERDGYTCQMCGAKGVYLEAHHIKAQSIYPELRFDIDNGMTLCKECHKKTDNYANKAKGDRNHV